jgi:hypothetical protein
MIAGDTPIRDILLPHSDRTAVVLGLMSMRVLH